MLVAGHGLHSQHPHLDAELRDAQVRFDALLPERLVQMGPGARSVRGAAVAAKALLHRGRALGALSHYLSLNLTHGLARMLASYRSP